jgi:epoxyqueuosine reductase
MLAHEGYSLASTLLPLKALAARSGLCEYGRNNVCYVPGMGSFLQLVAFYSDMPCSDDRWQEAKMMKSCQDCQLCIRACPTSAIPSDRFLLHAERCIVYHNEKDGSVPFPAWIKKEWHNCLVGCLRCQWACPLNKGLLKWIDETEEFSEEETKLLLEGATRDLLGAETIGKLEHLDLMDYLGSLPRNLSVFFGKGAHQKPRPAENVE